MRMIDEINIEINTVFDAKSGTAFHAFRAPGPVRK